MAVGPDRHLGLRCRLLKIDEPFDRQARRTRDDHLVSKLCRNTLRCSGDTFRDDEDSLPSSHRFVARIHACPTAYAACWRA